MITNREVSWIAPGVLVAVTLRGHRYRGHIVERTGRRTWRVAIDDVGDGGAWCAHGGGTFEVGTGGPGRVEHLLGTAMADVDAARVYAAYLADLAGHPDEDPAGVYALHYCHPDTNRQEEITTP